MFDKGLNTPLFYTSRSFLFNLLYMKDEKKTLLKKTVEHDQLTKFQNFSGKKMLSSITVANTLAFLGVPQI